MYSTCLFCKRPLGSNEVVETFPVGRRLAFDAARGRLWVVCRKCRRWKAEEIAAIADRVLLPAGTDAFFEKYRIAPESGSSVPDA